MGVFDRTFPVQVKFSDWSTDETDVKDYIIAVLVQSGGAGVGMGVVLSAIMTIALLLYLWCPCCCFRTCCLCCKVREPKWKKTTNRKIGFTLLFLCTLISFMGVAILYPSTIVTLSETDDTITNVRNTVDDFSDFVCGDPLTTSLRDGEDYDTYTTGKTASEMCNTSTSVSYFLTDTACKVNSTIDFIETKINNLTVVVTALESLTTAFSNFTNYTSELNKTLYDLDDDLDALNASVATYNAFLAEGNGVPTISYPLDISDYMIPDSTLTVTSNAVSELESEVTLLEGYVTDAKSVVETDLQVTTVNELASTKSTITSELNDLQDDILDFVDSANDLYGSVYDFQTDYFQEYEFYILLGYLIFNGVSVVCLCFQLVSFWRKWKCCSDCGTCCMFLMTFWTVTLLGLSVVGWLLTGDVCDHWFVGNAASNYEGIFDVNLVNETVSFGNVTIDLADTIENVLTCASGCEDVYSACGDLPNMEQTNTGCDATNNLYDMLQLNETLDFASDVQEAIDDINTYAPNLNYTVELDEAVDELYSQDVNESLSYDIPVDTTELSSYSTDLSNVKSALPGCTFSTSDCSKWLFVWEVSTLNCNQAHLEDNNPPDYTVDYITANCNYINYVQAIIDDIDTIVNGDAVTTLDTLQTELTRSRDDVATALAGVGSATAVATVAIEAMADVLLVLVTYIPAKAPSHMTCAWISSAWNTVVETDYCTNAYGNMGNLIAGMALSVLGMVLGFFVMMDLANVSRLEPSSPDDENDANRMNPHRWNHPGVEGRVIHEDSGLVRMADDDLPTATPIGAASAKGGADEGRTKYWNKDMSSNVDLRNANASAAASSGDVDMSDVSSLAARHCVASNVSRLTTSSSNLFGL